MPSRPEQFKLDLVDRVVERVHQRLDGERATQAEAFVRQFYTHVAPNDILEESPDNLYGSALSLWMFGQERAPGELKMRAYTPVVEDHGWTSTHTVLELVNDDMPFLVDSVIAELNRLEAEIHVLIHPVLCLERRDGCLVGLRPSSEALGAEPPAGASFESWMHVEISEQSAEQVEVVRGHLARVLGDVRSAVDDWQQMRQRNRDVLAELADNPPPLPADEIAHGQAFLQWLDDDHFTYLGYREYRFEGDGDAAVARVLPESGLGILRDERSTVFAGVRDFARLPADVRHFLRQPELLFITKANKRSTVHRPAYLDAIAVKSFDERGQVVGERLLIGLFTSAVYACSPREIPLLRQKVDNVVKRAGLAPRSHDGKALLHILESYPRDELFQISEDTLLEIATGILRLQERQRIALFVRRDPFERFLSCLVYVPRDRYDTTLRLRVQDILGLAFGGTVTAFYTHLTDAMLARLHFIVKTTPGEIPPIDLREVEDKLIDAGRNWVDRLEAALIENRGEEQGLRCARRFGSAFPPGYQEHFTEQAAVLDIGRIEQVMASGSLAMHLYRPLEATSERELRFKIYLTGQPVPLSDVLPMLENMGLKVIDEVPYDLRPSDFDQPVWIRDFSMLLERSSSVDLGAVRDTFHDAFARVWSGEMENDGFNKLVLHAGLSAREVTVVRAYSKYLRQVNIPFSQSYMEDTLLKHPEIARLLVDSFLLRLDPKRRQEAMEWGPALSAELESRLDGVTNLDDDRILRRFANVIEATLRTNFFQCLDGGGPKPYLSFKIDSGVVAELPLPRPFREIFVYSSRFEAIHLRGGLVARGGIRWSDRREDFRTEVLGLMKAQMVKNAVIVPVGSKGGFIVKNLPDERQAQREEVVACYKSMMRGLLDVTDNLVGNEVVPPPDVVRHDHDDPYLVVAADKGTATFSDIANGISAEYGFWLGDAFASGGSAGYDHKGMGITARGAWESVKRHFRETGKDVQSEPFTVVGVGDMAGDVFGNGMLLSTQIRLVGAFNHLHIFVDPDPDPELSWKERKRLFDTPGCTWADYDSTVLSAGGGVFDRRAKSIPVSPQAQQRFGLDKDKVTPAELIQALLRADVELLWLGGIGTYVKASDETHADVGDRANDALRVDATQVRARVVGEGANLGFTQRGRVELSLAGGRINTDFLDNSAGVDTSDHEVNIKILTGGVEAAGDLTRKQRDELLREMTDEVGTLVLRDNYLQTQAITVTHQLGVHLLDRLARVMRVQERSGRLNRRIEFLPDDEEVGERVKQGVGLTRPELAVLLAYAKIVLYEELLASDLPDDPYMEADLVLYFPTALRERFRNQIAEHRLRREIIATMVTNSIVNRVGPGFLHEVKEKTGLGADGVARAFVIAREVLALRPLWLAIEALDNVAPATVQAAMLVECGRLLERSTVWLLREMPQPLDIRTAIGELGEGVAQLRHELGSHLSANDRRILDDKVAAYAREQVPAELAEEVALLPFLAPVFDVVRIARSSGAPVADTARIYSAVGVRFGFEWLRRTTENLPRDSAWDKLAVSAVVDDLFGHQAQLTARIIEEAGERKVDQRLIERWAKKRRQLVTRTEQLLAELHSVGTPSLAMLAVANRQLKSLAG